MFKLHTKELNLVRTLKGWDQKKTKTEHCWTDVYRGTQTPAGRKRTQFCETMSEVKSQCLLFFVFLWERCGDRDLDFRAFLSGDGDRDLFNHLGDFVFIGEMLLDFRVCSSESRLCPRLLSSLFLCFFLSFLSSLSLDLDVDFSFFSWSFSNSYGRQGQNASKTTT